MTATIKSLLVSCILFAPAMLFAGAIDDILQTHQAEVGVEPNAPVSDEVFLRRVYLDAIGRIPTLKEAREFLQSEDPNKRASLIQQLLNSEGYVSHTL
ncbi:MAG: DUF1549 domain-containing protein, partial [Verrucomicrobiota bacterium]